MNTTDPSTQFASFDALSAGTKPRARKPWIVLVAIWLLIAAALTFQLRMDREETRSLERERLKTQARVIEENLTRQFVGVSAALAGIRYDIETGDHDASIKFAPLRLKTLSDAMPGVRSLLVVNAQGVVVDSDRSGLIGLDISQGESFRNAAGAADPTILYVSPPFKSVLGGVTISFGKVVRNTEGKFAGVILATMDPGYFQPLMSSVFYAPDMAGGIFHGDGKAAYLLPEDPNLLNVNVDLPGTMFRRHQETRASANVFEGEGVRAGQDRMVAIRTMQPPDLFMSRPLVIGVSRLRSAIYAPWQERVATIGGATFIAFVTSLVLLFFSRRRSRALSKIRASAEAQARESAQRLELAMSCGSIGLMDLDVQSGSLVLNSLARKILGLSRDAVMDVKKWRSLRHSDDADRATSALQKLMGAEQADYNVELRVRHALGHYVWLHVRAAVVARDAEEKATRVIITYRDVSERVAAEQQLRAANEQLAALSMMDDLTGVSNRRAFDQGLASAFARAKRSGNPTALLMIDIDYFKLYNDQYGHQQGDVCLRQVADVLASSVRRPDELLARYGGEEFAVLMFGSDLAEAVKLAGCCVERVRAAAIPHAASKVATHVTLSIGVYSLVPSQDTTPAVLVRAADTALYNAKANGRNQVCAI